MEEKITAIFVLIGCLGVLVMGFYLLAKDLDFFINKKVSEGKFRITRIRNNEIKLNVEYYDDNQGEPVVAIKSYKGNYLDNFQKLDSNRAEIIYTKWFKETYISPVQIPRVGILFLELVLILIGARGGIACIKYIRGVPGS